MIRTSFRLPLAIIRRLDSIAAELRKKQIGKVTRADVLRMLISEGLEQFAKQAAKQAEKQAERQVKRGHKR